MGCHIDTNTVSFGNLCVLMSRLAILPQARRRPSAFPGEGHEKERENERGIQGPSRLPISKKMLRFIEGTLY